MIVFTVIFAVAVINSHYQSIHILEQDGFLDLIWKILVIAVAQNTISLI